MVKDVLFVQGIWCQQTPSFNCCEALAASVVLVAILTAKTAKTTKTAKICRVADNQSGISALQLTAPAEVHKGSLRSGTRKDLASTKQVVANHQQSTHLDAEAKEAKGAVKDQMIVLHAIMFIFVFILAFMFLPFTMAQGQGTCCVGTWARSSLFPWPISRSHSPPTLTYTYAACGRRWLDSSHHYFNLSLRLLSSILLSCRCQHCISLPNTYRLRSLLSPWWSEHPVKEASSKVPIPPFTTPRTPYTSSSSRYGPPVTFPWTPRWLIVSVGRHYPHIHPTPPSSSLQDQAAKGHRRGYWRHTARSLCPRPCPRLHQCHLPCSLHGYTVNRGQHWSDSLPLPRRTRGRFAPSGQELENSSQCWSCGYGSPIRARMCYRIRTILSVSWW